MNIWYTKDDIQDLFTNISIKLLMCVCDYFDVTNPSDRNER